jgi:hypothetical protein
MGKENTKNCVILTPSSVVPKLILIGHRVFGQQIPENKPLPKQACIAYLYIFIIELVLKGT